MPPAAELVADKGDDSKALRDWLAERGTTAVIPPRKNRKVQYHYDKTVYRQRNIIERMVCLSLPFIPSAAETLEFCITLGHPFRQA